MRRIKDRQAGARLKQDALDAELLALSRERTEDILSQARKLTKEIGPAFAVEFMHNAFRDKWGRSIRGGSDPVRDRLVAKYTKPHVISGRELRKNRFQKLT